MRRAAVLLAIVLPLLAGCQSAYYAAAEQVGYAKRDILASRVKSARDSQEDAKQEITDALTAFGKVVNYQGGDLETQLRDQVLFLKHNLNARAIGGHKGEVTQVDTQVNQLVTEINKAIAEANRLIADLEQARD